MGNNQKFGHTDKRGATDKHRGGFLDALKRLGSSTTDLENDEMQETVRAHGSMPITTCEDRQLVKLVGTVATVTLNPRCGSPALQVELRDGSGTVTVVWLGRRSIPGITAGRAITIEGRISCAEGKRVVYNPRYELLGADSAPIA